MTVSVLWLFLMVLWVGLQCVIVVFPDHTHVLSFSSAWNYFISMKHNYSISNPWKCANGIRSNEHILIGISSVIMNIISKKDDKDQELLQSSTTPDPGYQWAKKYKSKSDDQIT